MKLIIKLVSRCDVGKCLKIYASEILRYIFNILLNTLFIASINIWQSINTVIVFESWVKFIYKFQKDF